jgi:hypothetical protein
MAHSDFEVFVDFKADVWIGRFSLNFPTLLKNVNDVAENPEIAISYTFCMLNPNFISTLHKI